MLKNFFSIIIALFLFSTISFSQEVDVIGTEVVNIVKPYSPTISDAFKVKETPVFNDSTNTVKKDVNYSIFSVPVASTFTPAKGKATSVEKTKPIKSYDNYGLIGFGNYTDIIAELYSNFEINRTDNFGLLFKHNSSQGGIKGLRLDDKFYDTKLEASFASWKKYINYQLKAGVKHQRYNWYGLNSLFATAPDAVINAINPKHSYFSGFVGGNFNMEDSYFKKVNANIRYLGDSFSSSEFNISALPEFSFPVSDYQIVVGATIDYLNGNFDRNYFNTASIKYSFLNFGITPLFKYVTEDLSLSLGIAAYLSLDSEKSNTNFYLYPKITASYQLVDETLIAYGGVVGGLTQNSYYNFKEENPFVSPTLAIMPTSEQYNVFGGLKGKFSNSVGYNVRTSYNKEDNKTLFKTNVYTGMNSSNEGYENGNSFNVVYDDLTTLTVFGELTTEISSNFSFGVNGTFNNYKTSNEAEAWNLPTIKASLFSDFNITKKLYGGVSLFFVGERKDAFSRGTIFGITQTEINLDSYFDANLYLGYQFKEQFSFFIKGSNLFGNNYQKWNNYKVQGTQVLGSATYKFNW